MLWLLLAACRAPPDPSGCEPLREVPYDGVDQDCDGADLVDVDQDGAPWTEDCDDADPARAPGLAEVEGDGVDQDCDGVDPHALGSVTGLRADEGYGSAVAWGPDQVLWVGAPWGGEGAPPAGRLYREGEVALDGSPGDGLGAAVVVLDDGSVRVGAPGRGAVLDPTGAVLAEAPGLGRLLATDGTSWVAAGGTTLLDASGATRALPERPDALAWSGGRLAVGWSRGAVAVDLDGVTLARLSTTDEAGAALLLGDADGDGADELVVGAPGANEVWVVELDALDLGLAGGRRVAGPTGRFGASLALGAPGVLYVGAPNDGPEAGGSVWKVEAMGTPVEVTAGDTPDDQLGTALAFSAGLLALGAPGRADTAGRVQVVRP